MAEEKKPEAAAAPADAAPKSGGMGAFLPLILAVVLMPAIAFGMTKFVLVPQLRASLGIKESAEGGKGGKGEKGGKKEEKTSVQFGKVLVNIAGTMGSRYLLVNITVVGKGGEEFKKKISEENKQNPELADAAGTILRQKTLTDLEKPGAANMIRTELINSFNNILGDACVSELYLTEFAVQ
jgi:flagellar basal body-associated protein FliL